MYKIKERHVALKEVLHKLDDKNLDCLLLAAAAERRIDAALKKMKELEKFLNHGRMTAVCGRHSSILTPYWISILPQKQDFMLIYALYKALVLESDDF